MTILKNRYNFFPRLNIVVYDRTFMKKKRIHERTHKSWHTQDIIGQNREVLRQDKKY